MKLDRQKWNEARLKLEAEIKNTKHSIRREVKFVQVWGQVGVYEDGRFKGMPKYDFVPTEQTYRGGTSEEYSLLYSAKEEVTLLYALRAALRNKVHCKGVEQEDALKLLAQFALPAIEEVADRENPQQV